MKINEIFYSIQGEGKLAGVPSVFVRTSGCNLRCTWCDTPHASWKPRGAQLDVDRIIELVSVHPTRHVVLTGGEPMIMPDAGELTRRLKHQGYHITIETAATVFADVVCDLASISPKLSNSTPTGDASGRWAQTHDAIRINCDVIRRFMRLSDYQLKFVIDAPEDLAEVDTLLAQIGEHDPGHVLLMPQGVTAAELRRRSRWLVDVCMQRGYRYGPRLQVTMFSDAPEA